MNEPDKQQRETRQRRLIYKVVANWKDHPRVEEIFQEVHTLDARISLATVYRNLNLLSENGEILHVRVPGADRFDSTLTRHDHIFCIQCGRVIDAPLSYQEEKDLQAQALTGFSITGHSTVYEGTCPRCLEHSAYN